MRIMIEARGETANINKYTFPFRSPYENVSQFDSPIISFFFTSSITYFSSVLLLVLILRSFSFFASYSFLYSYFLQCLFATAPRGTERSFLVTDGERWWSDLEICRTAVLQLGAEKSRIGACKKQRGSKTLYRGFFEGSVLSGFVQWSLFPWLRPFQ